MTSTTQSHTHNITGRRPPHQSQLTGNPPEPGNTTHSLATAAGSAVYTTENHLAGLVEAATAAAGQNVGWAQPEDGDTTMSGEARVIQSQLDGYTVGMQLEDGFTNPGNAPSSHFILPGPSGQASANGGKQIAPATDSGPPTEGNPSGRKRKRDNANVDPTITGNPSLGANGAEPGQHGHTSADGLNIRDLPPQQAISNARAAGVHSAVALFRQPSATSKKYTRPPMSKLFASLELSPENFLHLQAAAKAYMLDVNHPERRDCVGQRGKGDTEMVRLRLWNCVSEFLDKEGNGPRFFGENVVNEGMGPRQMIWPRDDQKIISLMMPLLRRMVTNERQRQYAIETRKCGNSEEKKRKQMETGIPNTSAPTHETHFQQLGETGIGMLDLLSGGYPSDWESITQSYDSYNEGYRLDNLGAISGLPQQDWLGLVAAVDCHYQIDHHGNGAECDQPCQDCMVNHIVSSDSVSHANWRIAGQGDGLAARTYFASGITRDVSHIIKESLINRAGNPHDPKFTSSATFAERPSSEPFVPQPSALAPIVPATHSAQGPPRQESKSLTSVKLFISIVQNGDDKRLLPRLELPCDPSAGLSALLKNVRQYYQQQQHLQTHQMPVNFRINAWLKNGLVPIGNDEEWMAALMAAHMVDWMDGELRIIVDGGGGNV
ncbi:uncharacterized protein CIMG_02165 [Coccidioides immitis RS]|uniref:Uncharacterized protein n=3 Tax=Coccidioides immitis TaxID=5501 RepID=A0A0E1RYV0_COCIM|nr:uncharacterized protein CIMG_02165 [Coccidioides immitis RS]EAS36811.1 hypothetical protein CIMG_02165 [Coccidioides immitis RS]KMU90160.1 hypothetical protein CIHG_07970 [Coccidioides immitis H538.4]TPX25130.1 hypothetical protein DIZ76_010579 [Coccidioides immitis]